MAFGSTPPQYRLRYLGDPVLRTVCSPVEGEPPQDLIREMYNFCRRYRAQGLAAPQFGVSLRLILVFIGGDYRVIINPDEKVCSGSVEVGTEGCYSIPGFTTGVSRFQVVEFIHLDQDLVTHRRKLQGRASVAFQHEFDHLNGRLIVDGLPRPDRRRAEQLVAKHLKRHGK